MKSRTSCSRCSKLGKRRPSTSSLLKVATQASAIALMLLCQVECCCGGEVGDEEAVEAASEVALEAAEDLSTRESFAGAAGGVDAGLRMVDEPVVGDRPKGVVALAVAAGLAA